MKTRAFLLALPLLALGLSGCVVGNNASLQIQGVCVPEAGCAFSATCGSFIVANPTLDTSVTKYMTLFFQVENQLKDNAGADVFRLNTNAATIEEAHVEYSGVLGGSVTFGVNAQVPASSTTVVGVDVIPGSVGAVFGSPGAPPAYPLFSEAIAKLKLRGHYADGSSFETGEFLITIDVTSGAPQTATCGGACPQAGQYPAACP
jgi:hypothetical protein